MMRTLGQIFGYEPVQAVLERTGVWGGGLRSEVATAVEGLTAGTQVASATGWRSIETLEVGDKVLTFDAGLQTVRRIVREWSYADDGTSAPCDWPLHIPAGAIGNREAMTLLPDQAVMVESDAGEAMFGDPFTLVPAGALDGYKGITRKRPDQPIETVRLEFDTEQVIFANVGALFHCPAAAEMTVACLMEEQPVPGYEVLSLVQARGFITALTDEEALDAAWIEQERKARRDHPAQRYAH